MRDDDSALSRRDFIERTAYAAGLAGVAGVPLELILAEEAEAKQVPVYEGKTHQIFREPHSLRKALRSDHWVSR